MIVLKLFNKYIVLPCKDIYLRMLLLGHLFCLHCLSQNAERIDIYLLIKYIYFCVCIDCNKIKVV